MRGTPPPENRYGDTSPYCAFFYRTQKEIFRRAFKTQQHWTLTSNDIGMNKWQNIYFWFNCSFMLWWMKMFEWWWCGCIVIVFLACGSCFSSSEDAQDMSVIWGSAHSGHGQVMYSLSDSNRISEKMANAVIQAWVVCWTRNEPWVSSMTTWVKSLPGTLWCNTHDRNIWLLTLGSCVELPYLF